jgi:hypothetical protein
MSNTLQTIEPDEPTSTPNSQLPTRNVEPPRPLSGAVASSVTPGDAESGIVVISDP